MAPINTKTAHAGQAGKLMPVNAAAGHQRHSPLAQAIVDEA
jgi:hypothetical protein